MAKANKQYGTALLQPSTLNREERTVDVVFATETPVARNGWSENYDEVLNCDAASMRMDVANKGLPVVDSHNTWSIFSQIGVASKVWINDKRECCATLHFSKRGDVDAIFNDIADGIVRNISVGYRVYKYEREPQAEGKNPIYRAVDWKPCEISFVSVPADINSGVRSGETESNECEIIETNNKVREMEKQVIETNSVAVDTIDVEKVRSEASLQERARFDAILQAVRAAKLADADAIEWFGAGKTLDECRAAIIDKLVAGQPQVDGHHADGIRVGEEAIEKKRQAAADAILHRLNPRVFKIESGKNEYRGMTLVEMARELLAERGVSTRGMGKVELADYVFKRTHTTSDFPLLFEGVIDRALRADYAFAPEFWDKIARLTNVSDYRPKALYQVDSANGMQETPEGDEIKYTTLVEGKATLRVKSYAEGIKFTRQAFVNDDLGALTIVQSRFVKDWNELRGDLVWGLLTNSTTMSDGKLLFHADHNNLLSGANSALSQDGLAAGILKLRKQKGIDGKRALRIMPKYLIVPPDLEVTARKLLTAVTPSSTADVNVFANTMEIIVENRLTDARAWYLAADPNAADGLYYGYLDGGEALRVNNEDDFNTDSMKYAVRGEFGVAAVDFRALVKSNGV